MVWDGVERRKNFRGVFCEDHIKLCEDTATIKNTVINLDRRINGSIDAIEKHVKDGKTWRVSIVATAFALFVNIISFSYMYGKLCQQVTHLAYAQEKIEELFPRGRQGKQGAQGVPGIQGIQGIQGVASD